MFTCIFYFYVMYIIESDSSRVLYLMAWRRKLLHCPALYPLLLYSNTLEFCISVTIHFFQLILTHKLETVLVLCCPLTISIFLWFYPFPCPASYTHFVLPLRAAELAQSTCDDVCCPHRPSALNAQWTQRWSLRPGLSVIMGSTRILAPSEYPCVCTLVLLLSSSL